MGNRLKNTIRDFFQQADLVLLGLCVLGGLMAVELCKLLWQLTVWLAHKIKGLFIRKEENV